MYFLGFTEMMGVTKTQNPHCQKQPVTQIMPNQNKTSQIQSINHSINQSINQSYQSVVSISRINNEHWWVYKYMSFSILLASDEPNPPVSKVSWSCMVRPVTIIQPLGSPGIDGERVGRNLCGWPSHFPWKRFSDTNGSEPWEGWDSWLDGDCFLLWMAFWYWERVCLEYVFEWWGPRILLYKPKRATLGIGVRSLG